MIFDFFVFSFFRNSTINATIDWISLIHRIWSIANVCFSNDWSIRSTSNSFFARELIKTSTVYIVMLMFWIEIDNLILLHAFCMIIVSHTFCIIIEMIVQIWKIFFLHWFSRFSQRQWDQIVEYMWRMTCTNSYSTLFQNNKWK